MPVSAFNYRLVRRRKVKHRIADIHYGENAGPSWCTCTCGERFEAPSPTDLSRDWGRHVPIPTGIAGGQRITPMTPAVIVSRGPRCGFDGCELLAGTCRFHPGTAVTYG